jgi:hypothetical protein
MIQTGKIFLILAIAIFCGLAAVPSAKAGPLFFSNVVALQNNGSARVDLFSNSGTTLLGPQVSFLVDITGSLSPGTTYSLLVTYVEAGGAPLTQTFQIPAFGSIQPPFTQLFTINSPGASYQGVLATLTVDIIGSAPDFVIPSGPNAGQSVDSYTYHFNVSTPVPEPLSLILFGTGVLGVWRRTSQRRRRRGQPSPGGTKYL